MATRKQTLSTDKCALFLQHALPQVTGWLVLLVSIAFFTGTYDSALVKLTLLQVGSLVLATLWACLKITQRQNPFTRQRLLFLAPLLAYLSWQTLAFLFFPYHLETAEEFVRLWMYGALAGLIACEFTVKNIQTLTRFVLAAAWISVGYGVLQIINIWLPGTDLLPWHGFFGNRIFSTHANPNFFGAFLVVLSAIAGAEFLRTRKKSLLVLLLLGLIDLIFTESKGAWLAYGFALVTGSLLYTNAMASVKKHLKTINIAALVFLLITIGAAGIYSTKRFQSVSFRAYTWVSTLEMIQKSPWLGTGPGSFKLVYPTFRKPQIFYIENAHNTETQHAENEYLEQAATGGIIGLALFLWLMTFLLIGSFKHLSCPAPTNLNTTDKKILIQRRWYLLGYTTALAGLLVHAFVDISIHFASGGILLAVTMGTLLALMLNNSPTQSAAPQPEKPFIIPVRLAAYLAVILAGGYVLYLFYGILHNMATQTWNEKTLWGLSAAGFLAVVGGVGCLYLQVIRRTARAAVCGLICISLIPGVYFVRFFAANHYYSLGVALIQLKQPQAALGAFGDAIELNPWLSEYRHYRANIFAGRWNMSKQLFKPWGDRTTPRNDFERAKDDLDFAFKHNPNHALLSNDAGSLHYRLGIYHLNQAQINPSYAPLYRQLAEENFALAQEHLRRALCLDPVNPSTYLLLANMALVKHDMAQAQAWVDTYLKGPRGVTEEEFLIRHRQNPQIQELQSHINRVRQAGQ